MVLQRPKIITPPTVEPVTVDEARTHLEAQRYADSDVDALDDAMIAGFISAARQRCETFTGLTLAPATLEIALDAWPASTSVGGVQVELPGAPVRRIVQITIGDPGSSDNELDPAAYVLDDYPLVPRVMPVSGAWSSITASLNSIRVRYDAGYAAPEEAAPSSDSEWVEGPPLPPAIRAAVLLLTGHLYENREAVNVGNIVTTLPLGVESLLRPHRINLGMA